jgi:hypothetical protein
VFSHRKIRVKFRKANSILINQPYFKVGKQQECSSGKQEARTSGGISLKPESAAAEFNIYNPTLYKISIMGFMKMDI